MYRITTGCHKLNSHFYSNIWCNWFSQLMATKALYHQLSQPRNSSIVLKTASRRPHVWQAYTPVLLDHAHPYCFGWTQRAVLSSVILTASHIAFAALGRDCLVPYHRTITAVSIVLNIKLKIQHGDYSS